MDFLRKLFPSSKKNMVSHTDSILTSKDTSLNINNNSQDHNIDTILRTNNVKGTKKDASFEITEKPNSNNSLHSVEDVPLEISPNNIKTDQILPEFKVPNDIKPAITTFNEDIEKNCDERPINANTNVLEPVIIADGLVCNKEATAFNDKELTTNEACSLNIADETLQSLKEFEETLNNYESSNNFRTEYINLDDFYEIFNALDTVNDDNSTKVLIDSKNNNDDDVKIIEDVNVFEDIDVISINSSTKDCQSQTEDVKETIYISLSSDADEVDTQSSECDGYNSSDFEFISEAEAKLDGLIINFKGVNRQNSSHYISEFENVEGFNIDEVFDPCEGPSGQNRPRNQFEDRSYRNNHQIPLGDDYLALFQGIYNPVLPMSEIFFLENKSVRTSAMNSQYDGIGFVKQLALRRQQPDSSEDEFADEAKECAKQILKTYPRDNRKRRRRH
ncbi:uncharacterized protein LOC124643241 [Helicoverpa zea]|uniref:uncharacterized protein LOC124643241 n=1 Tax=Helicoverpa zea TaxID=7113 RepID=UPI001F588F53|nr:uncharacterized protein LOC124643241 [Helicoverpa zea]XP_047038093.1 uncharacterized protein LOC124643241 [Helicoverpa zea]